MASSFERRAGARFDRRQFLATAAKVPLAAALLAACTSDTASEPTATRSGAPLPLFDDIPAIADGLAPERNARLRIYGWGPSYFSPKILRGFEERYECTIEFIPFREMGQALSRLRTGSLDVDIFVPTIKVLSQLASARMLRPLNYTYIPNLQANVWDSMVSPFYDPGPRYSVPYFVWTVGVSWRNDLPGTDPRGFDNPYDVFWDPRHRKHVHVLNSVQDLVGMALLRTGEPNPNTSDPAAIGRAREALLDMVDATLPRIDSSDYRDLFTGSAHVHQSWSGNLAFAKHYATDPSEIERLSYWWPPQDGPAAAGLKGSDVLVIPANARNPVLAHHFVNFCLDTETAEINSTYNGYQAPINSLDGNRLIATGVIPSNLSTIVVTKEDFELGTYELELSPEADALFNETYDWVVRETQAAWGEERSTD